MENNLQGETKPQDLNCEGKTTRQDGVNHLEMDTCIGNLVKNERLSTPPLGTDTSVSSGPDIPMNQSPVTDPSMPFNLDSYLHQAHFIEDETWNKDLQGEIAKQWQQQQLCDLCIVSAEGRELYAHACVVGASSPKLFQMISAYTPQPGQQVYGRNAGLKMLRLSGINQSTLCIVLCFIYFGKACVPASEFSVVYNIAEFMGITSMLKKMETSRLKRYGIPGVLSAGTDSGNDFQNSAGLAVSEGQEIKTEILYQKITAARNKMLGDVQVEEPLRFDPQLENTSASMEQVATGKKRKIIEVTREFEEIDEATLPEVKKAKADYCMYCGELYVPDPKYIRHQCGRELEKNEHNEYKCPLPDCDNSFLSKHMLQDHIMVHYNVNLFTCKICGWKGKCIKRMRLHIKSSSMCVNRAPEQRKIIALNSGNPKRGPSRRYKRFPNVEIANIDYCVDCGQVFSTEHPTEQEPAVHGCGKYIQRVRGKYPCPNCAKLFDTKNAVWNHMHIHYDIRKYSCVFCKGQYKNNIQAFKHANFFCPDRDKERTVKSWNYEEEEDYAERKNICDKCDMRFHKEEDLEIHLRVHTVDQEHQCDQCQQTFTQEVMLQVHEKTVHNIQVPALVKQSNVGHQRLPDMPDVERVNKDFCMECGEMYNIRPEMRGPQLHGCGKSLPMVDNQYPCPLCGKLYLAKYSIKGHLQTHYSDIMQYRCKLCGHGTKVHYMMVEHCKYSCPKRDSVKLICSLCGERRFPNPKKLKEHEKECHLTYTYECNICKPKLAFKSSATLKRHMSRLHSGKKQTEHLCPTCGKKFSNATNVRLHMRIHTGEKPFVCEVCGKGFRLKCMMQNHVKSKHRDENGGQGETMKATKFLVLMNPEAIVTGSSGEASSSATNGEPSPVTAALKASKPKVLPVIIAPRPEPKMIPSVPGPIQMVTEQPAAVSSLPRPVVDEEEDTMITITEKAPDTAIVSSLPNFVAHQSNEFSDESEAKPIVISESTSTMSLQSHAIEEIQQNVTGSISTLGSLAVVLEVDPAGIEPKEEPMA